MAVSIYIIMQE